MLSSALPARNFAIGIGQQGAARCGDVELASLELAHEDVQAKSVRSE